MGETSVEGYPSRKAASASGLTLAMVDYLARSKVVLPSIAPCPGRGKARRYSFGDLVALRIVQRLLKGGISVSRLKKSLAELQRAYGRELRATPADYFCTDGQRVLFKTEKQLVADLTNGSQLAFSFMLDLRQIHQQTHRKLGKRQAA